MENSPEVPKNDRPSGAQDVICGTEMLATASPEATPPRKVSPLVFLSDGVRVAAVSLVLYVLFFNLSVVRGNSMAPGIHDGDRIFVEPWSFVVDDVSLGDVVVLRYPLDPRVDYIKRVIGVPGDHVVLADGYVWVNGELLTEPYVADVDRSSYVSCIVDEGNVFVLGDNRPRSSDSREFGLVPLTYLRGRVDLRLWPLSRAGWIN
ncbi:MAG: signal peptidase I [Planctomycetota bacterium]|jgi:signal peptidase I